MKANSTKTGDQLKAGNTKNLRRERRDVGHLWGQLRILNLATVFDCKSAIAGKLKY